MSEVKPQRWSGKRFEDLTPRERCGLRMHNPALYQRVAESGWGVGKETNMTTTNEAPKPLTSAEARENIKAAEESARTALAAGDEKAWMHEQQRRAFHMAALELAEKREAEEAEAARRREMEATRPLAEEAIRAATLELAARDEIAAVEAAVDALIATARTLAAKVPAIHAAQDLAGKLSRQSGVPFVPEVVNTAYVANALRNRVVARIVSAGLTSAEADCVPGVNLSVNPNRPDASFRFPVGRREEVV